MIVRELVALLQKQNQDAVVGVTGSHTHGFIEGIAGLVTEPNGMIGIDTNETNLNPVDEQGEMGEIKFQKIAMRIING